MKPIELKEGDRLLIGGVVCTIQEPIRATKLGLRKSVHIQQTTDGRTTFPVCPRNWANHVH